ncbi:MAG TPA: mechanosensitive ion channel family protein [Phycisphaerae bacterium]|nr:mechanosensitive ion channel family protein [Phycisphaerae bacterium]
MWDQLVNLFSQPVVQAAVLSALCLLLAAAAYFVLRRRLRAAGNTGLVLRGRLRLLGAGIALILLLVLVRVWSHALGGADSGQLARRAQAVLENVFWTCAAGGVVYLLVSAVRRPLISSSVDLEARHRIRLATAWVGIVVFVVATVLIWTSGIQDLGVFLGIVGAGVALSLQETLLCIAGWLLLVVRRHYDIGDRIEIDGRIGDVIGISVFQTSMLEVGNWVKADQTSGRMLIIPNSLLLRHALYNYTKGFPFVWNEFTTVVTFESDWEQAKKLMLELADFEADKIETEVKRNIEGMQSQYAIRYRELRPIVYTSIADQGVRLTLRFLSPVRARRGMNHRIAENVLRAFLSHPGIDFAYPTTRMYRNDREGKPHLRRGEAARPPDSAEQAP